MERKGGTVKKIIQIMQSRIVFLVLGGLLGGIFGSGALWEWRKTGTEQAKYELEKAKQILDVREKLEGNILKVLEIYRNSDNVGQEKDPIKKEYLSRDVGRDWKYKFPIIKNNINQLESILAKLENRELRNFDNLQPIPYNLRLITIPDR